jgi:hypothetical protein
MINREPTVATDDQAYFNTSNQFNGASSKPLSKLGPRLAAVGLVGSEDSASASRIASVDRCEVISACALRTERHATLETTWKRSHEKLQIPIHSAPEKYDWAKLVVSSSSQLTTKESLGHLPSDSRTTNSHPGKLRNCRVNSSTKICETS